MVMTPAQSPHALAYSVDVNVDVDAPGLPHMRILDFCAPEKTPTRALPHPDEFLRSLTLGVLEVIAGVREASQLARWLAQEPFLRLVTRANLAARARSARGVPARRPRNQIMSLRYSSPADGVIEASLVVDGVARTRAVAIRLEGLDGRWRATDVAIL